MVDSTVRVQLSPSPVDHEANTVGFDQGTRFIQNKYESIYTFSHTICLTSSSLLPLLHFITLHPSFFSEFDLLNNFINHTHLVYSLIIVDVQSLKHP